MLLSSFGDTETAAAFALADIEEDMMLNILPEGFGALIDGIAATEAAKKPQKTKKVGLLTAAEKALSEGKDIPLLVFTSAANYSYNARSEALWGMAQAGSIAALRDYPVTGQNTYAKALRRYQAILVASLEAQVKPTVEGINLAVKAKKAASAKKASTTTKKAA